LLGRKFVYSFVGIVTYISALHSNASAHGSGSSTLTQGFLCGFTGGTSSGSFDSTFTQHPGELDRCTGAKKLRNLLCQKRTNEGWVLEGLRNGSSKLCQHPFLFRFAERLAPQRFTRLQSLGFQTFARARYVLPRSGYSFTKAPQSGQQTDKLSRELKDLPESFYCSRANITSSLSPGTFS
jgi:hypothetical protein